MILAATAAFVQGGGKVHAANWVFVFDHPTVAAAINALPAGQQLSCAVITPCVGEYEFFAKPTGLTSYTMSSASTNVGAGTASEWKSDTTSAPLIIGGTNWAHWIDRPFATGGSYNTIAMVTENTNVIGRVYSGGYADGQTGAVVPNTAKWTAIISTNDPITYGSSVTWQWYASGIVLKKDGKKDKYATNTGFTINGVVAAPEPGLMGLVAAAVAGLCLARRRGKSRG
jgi:hypothetical protein